MDFLITNRNKLKDFLIVVFVVLVYSHILYSIYNIVTTKAPDFEVLWLGAKDLLSGRNPYLNKEAFTGIGYPLTTLVFYIPFSFLNFEVAQTVFVLLSFLAVLLSVYLSNRIIGNKAGWRNLLLFSSIALLSFPTKFTLGMGQNNAIALLFLLLFYFFHKKDKWDLSGFFLGLSFSLKTIFLFFLLFPILKKAWRQITIALVVFLIFFVISNFWSNLGYYSVYYNKIIMPLLTMEGREVYYNQGVSGFVARGVKDLSWRYFLTALLSLGIVINSVYLALKSKKQILVFSLFITTLLLVDSLSWQHHFVWLIFPAMVLVSEYMKKRKIRPLLLTLFAIVLVGWNFKNPGLYASFPQSLILSNTFYGALVLYFLNSRLLTS